MIPTSKEINNLPENLRCYIHDLETICDPAGMLRQIAGLKINQEALVNWKKTMDEEIKKLEEKLAAKDKELERINKACDIFYKNSKDNSKLWEENRKLKEIVKFYAYRDNLKLQIIDDELIIVDTDKGKKARYILEKLARLENK